MNLVKKKQCHLRPFLVAKKKKRTQGQFIPIPIRISSVKKVAWPLSMYKPTPPHVRIYAT